MRCGPDKAARLTRATTSRSAAALPKWKRQRRSTIHCAPARQGGVPAGMVAGTPIGDEGQGREGGNLAPLVWERQSVARGSHVWGTTDFRQRFPPLTMHIPCRAGTGDGFCRERGNISGRGLRSRAHFYRETMTPNAVNANAAARPTRNNRSAMRKYAFLSIVICELAMIWLARST
jgi:hypothetical protein